MFRPALAILALVVAAPLARAAGDPLDEALLERAPKILGELKKRGFTNIGVVKFLVRHGEMDASDDVGDLNLTLANKLEVALILANDDDKFGVIDKASEQVVREKLLGANHLSEPGRQAFFVRKYELAWSRDKVDASGFLTALATFAPDLSRLTLQVQVFDKTGRLEELTGTIAAPTAPELLAQAGFSYALAPARQKALVAGEPPPAREVQKQEIVERVARSAEPMAREADAPLADCPIKLTLLYNGKPVSVSHMTVAEPKATDRVEFTLENPTDGTYAVVLLVNGENTLYQERTAPAACRKWVLGPKMSVTIKGYQVGQDRVAPFTVLPPEEPLPDAVRYGDHAGTFRLVVFHGKMTDANPADNMAISDAKDSAALALSRTRGGTRPAGVKPQALKALQADLRGRLGVDGARGYVVKSGATETFATRSVYFVPSPELPVADISLRYAGKK
jgi:hypothetical protein